MTRQDARELLAKHTHVTFGHEYDSIIDAIMAAHGRGWDAAVDVFQEQIDDRVRNALRNRLREIAEGL